MPSMSSRERLLAAYRHDLPDCIPCSPRMGPWLVETYGDANLDTHLRAARELDYDPHFIHHVYWSPFELGVRDHYDLPEVDASVEWSQEGDFRVARRTFHTPAGTLTDRISIPPAGDRSFGMNPNPFRTEYLLTSRDDLEALRYLIPDPTRAPVDSYFAKEEYIGDRGLLMYHVHSALNHRAGEVVSTENLMLMTYDDPALFDELMGLFHALQLAEIRVGLDAGIKHFFLNWYYNSMSTGWSPAIWKRTFLPQLTECCKLIHSQDGTVNYYDDGKCMPILGLLADAGIDVLQTLTPPPVGDTDLAEAKRRIGNRVCLMGYIDLIYVLLRGTPQTIRDAVKQAVDSAGPTGFILGTSDSIRDGTPLENVQAYTSAAREFGALNP